MKFYYSFYLIIFILITPSSYCQSIGFFAGYGFLNMGEVNSDLKTSHSSFASFGAFASPPEEVNGGLFLEGNIKFGIANFNLGLSGNYISSSGSFRYSDEIGLFEESYDVSTTEILGLFEIFIVEESIVKPFLQLAGGIGFAKAEHLGNLRIFADPTYNLKVTNTVDGSYFAGRIKGGLKFFVQSFVFEIGLGYRIADAGELVGDHVENGIKYANMPVRDVNGKGIKFDYSGLILTGGISILIF
ncbi:MAG: hypothetical protein P8X47_06605 [Ignavibacteriaceae bacterium]